MDSEEREKEKRISALELEGEELDRRMSLEQKKAVIKELRRTYGKDWRKIIGGTVGKLRVNVETMHALHGFGGGGLLGPRKPRDRSWDDLKKKID